MSEGKFQWYALRAISGKEAKVKETLDATCKNTSLGDFVQEVLIPTEKAYVTRAGKKVLKERNKLPGYVFVLLNLTGEVEETLRNTTNIIDFVRTHDKNRRPEPIRESDMARMMGAVETEQEAADSGVNDYEVGDKVKVIDGPFTNFVGNVEEVNREKRKLKVEVSVFGRPTPVELDNSQVERQ
ncbi:MAG: transcription termination/antitermination protein NusG [Bacteroidales bacterium]|nr:transcription termination/antitermination protein NusG [Bacteroidales bacterium]MDY3912080.1 transcription termination/antitermination protein NusG [Sodaliphilus sp.]